MKTRSHLISTIAAVIGVTLCASSASALCVYEGNHFEKSTSPDFDGRLYATTTLMDEFADSALVIKGTAISSQHVPPGGEFFAATVYNIRVDQTFKGTVPKTLHYYTENDSGRFNLDVGTPFLLFLKPMPADYEDRKIAPGAFLVNYNCGQSRPWSEISAIDRDQLAALSRRKPAN
jgi:hypothetical protein